MEQNLVLLLLLAPFFGFLFNIFYGKKVSRNVSGTIGTLAVVISFLASVVFFINIKENPVQVNLFDWIEVHNFKLSFGFLLDQLSILWL